MDTETAWASVVSAEADMAAEDMAADTEAGGEFVDVSDGAVHQNGFTNLNAGREEYIAVVIKIVDN